jgi:hypothetical protein
MRDCLSSRDVVKLNVSFCSLRQIGGEQATSVLSQPCILVEVVVASQVRVGRRFKCQPELCWLANRDQVNN